MILKLKDTMKSRSLTSVELAERIGVTKATISYWINGKVFPSPEMLTKIATALNVPLWQLFASAEEVMSETSHSHAGITCPKCGAKLTLKVEE